MLIPSAISRRSTKRPFIIICAIMFTVLLKRQIVTPSVKPSLSFEDSVDDVGRALSTVSRIYSRKKAAMAYTGRSANEKTQKLEDHRYRQDGLLEVNSEGPHPIYELVRQAQDDWDAKLRNASTTLDQAVAEYQRRYKRLPPKGFDDWWTYVVEKNVQLPDEYDQIYRDLEPFWGMHLKDLQKLQRDWEAHVDSFTIGKDSYDDPLSLKNYSAPSVDTRRDGHAKGAYEMIELLEEVEDMLPPFRAVFSPHDNPNLATNYELREEALQAAQTGTYINVDSPLKSSASGWLTSCSSDSAARKQDINWEGPPRQPSSYKRKKTFIYNHRTSMDPCQHPSHFLLHGQFISHRRGPTPHRFMVPQFSYGPTMVHHDITPAMPINWVDDIRPRSDDPEWEERWDTRLQWRGSNTGIWHTDDIRWDLAQRARLVRWGGNSESDMPKDLSVLPPVEENKKVGRPMKVRKAQWAPAMVDVAFAGNQINCKPEMCKKLDRIFEYRKRQDVRTAGRYKYYIDVDGNGWSSRFKRLITSNALVFKSTIYPEWYTDRIAPWVHYVPIQIDLSDLWDALFFFRGDPLEKGGHDDMAKKIALEGRAWSKTFWRKEDMVAYNFRLFLEYSRVMSLDRDLLSFDP